MGYGFKEMEGEDPRILEILFIKEEFRLFCPV